MALIFTCLLLSLWCSAVARLSQALYGVVFDFLDPKVEKTIKVCAYYNKYLVSQQRLSISPKLVHICLTVVVMLVVDFSELEIRSDEF